MVNQIPTTRSKIAFADNKKTYFVCQEQRIDFNRALVDNYHHFDNDASRVLKSAAKHLQGPLCGPAHDICGLDIYYHESCYLKLKKILAQGSRCQKIDE